MSTRRILKQALLPVLSALVVAGCGGGGGGDDSPSPGSGPAPADSVSAKQITADSVTIGSTPQLLGEFATYMVLAYQQQPSSTTPQLCGGGGTIVHQRTDADGVLNAGDEVSFSLDKCVMDAGGNEFSGQLRYTVTAISGEPGTAGANWSISGDVNSTNLAVGPAENHFEMNGTLGFTMDNTYAGASDVTTSTASAESFLVKRVKPSYTAFYTLSNTSNIATWDPAGDNVLTLSTSISVQGLPIGTYAVTVTTSQPLVLGSDLLPSSGTLSMVASGYSVEATFSEGDAQLSVDKNRNGTIDATPKITRTELTNLP